MTCIVGFVDRDDKRVYIGGDSAGVSGSNIRVRADEKVFIKDNMIFGFTSSFRMGQIIRYSFRIPKQEHEDDFEYLCTDFINYLKECLESHDFKDGGRFLLGYNGNLYCIQEDFQVAKNDYGYDACGSGEEYALGCLNALNTVDTYLSAKSKINIALETASKFSTDVCSPNVIYYI